MTLAERLEAKGKAEATRRIAASMLAKGFEANLVSELTGLPVEIIHSLPAM